MKKREQFKWGKNKTNLLIIGLVIACILTVIAGVIHDRQQQIVNASIVKEVQEKVAKEKAQEEENARQKKIKGVGHTVHYVAIGDSLTAGYYATSQDKTFVQLISNNLKKNMGFDVVVDQHGRPGAKLEWGLGEVSKINEEKPDLITIEFGTNDADPRFLTNVQLFETQLNTLVNDLTVNAGRNPEIVLVTTWNQNTHGGEYDAIIQKVGKEKHLSVVSISNIYKDSSTVGPEGRNTYLGKGDATHPNDQGMKEISDAIYKEIEPLVIKLVDEKKI